jgi:hypothetical protein
MPRTLVAASAVVLLGFAGWWWWPTDESRVRAHLERMTAAVNGRDGESDLERMARMATLASGLTPDVFVDAAGHTLEGRDAVLAAIRARMISRRHSVVDLAEVSVTMASDRMRADARVVASVDDEYQALRVSLVQRDGTWLVAGVEADQALRRPGGASPR